LIVSPVEHSAQMTIRGGKIKDHGDSSYQQGLSHGL
jgi:hypothetical protein